MCQGAFDYVIKELRFELNNLRKTSHPQTHMVDISAQGTLSFLKHRLDFFIRKVIG